MILTLCTWERLSIKLISHIPPWCLQVILLTWSTSLFAAKTKPEQDPLIVKHASTHYEYFMHRESYFINLLTLVLEKSGVPHKRVPVNLTPLTENRSIHYLQSGTYTIHWLNTSKQLEQKLLPVRIPLFKGLIGWRLLLIRNSDVDLFKSVKTVEDLKKFRFLQGDDWPDTPVLMDNGFNLVTSSDFATLSKMLGRGRGDVFPRSIIEVWEELDYYADLNVTIENNLVLHYPAAYYFFVAPGNTALRDAVEKGLNIAVRDGSFDILFTQYFGDVITRANLSQRKVISLPNPYMSDQTPIERNELWLNIR